MQYSYPESLPRFTSARMCVRGSGLQQWFAMTRKRNVSGAKRRTLGLPPHQFQIRRNNFKSIRTRTRTSSDFRVQKALAGLKPIRTGWAACAPTVHDFRVGWGVWFLFITCWGYRVFFGFWCDVSLANLFDNVPVQSVRLLVSWLGGGFRAIGSFVYQPCCIPRG